jgi:hypothetical protein
VQGLRVLAGVDLGGIGEAELGAGPDHLVRGGQDERVQGSLVHAAAPGQQSPGPAAAIEARTPPCRGEQPADLVTGSRERVVAETARYHRVAVLLELPGDLSRAHHA